MISKIVKTLILVPLGILLVGFAVANRQAIVVSFDPFDASQPSHAATVPLFILIFVLVILGVLIGGIATWLRQRKWRRAVRRLETENRELHAELYDLKRQQGGPVALPPGSPAVTRTQRDTSAFPA